MMKSTLLLISIYIIGLCFGDHSDKCHLQRMTGPCRGSFQRYYYDSDSQECKPFTYGGCQGNDNRFSTKQDCENECVYKQDATGYSSKYDCKRYVDDASSCSYAVKKYCNMAGRYDQLKCDEALSCCQYTGPKSDEGTCLLRKRKIRSLLHPPMCTQFETECTVSDGMKIVQPAGLMDEPGCSCATTISGETVCANVPINAHPIALLDLCKLDECDENSDCNPNSRCIEVEEECVTCNTKPQMQLIRMMNGGKTDKLPGRCVPLCIL